LCGRRGGKSRYAAFLACFYALQDYSQYLAAGEVATCAILASDRKQARAIFRYVSGFLRGHPLLADIVEVEGAETVKLRNRVVIEISTASFRGIRGYTFACLLCDEVALWRSDDSVNPDVEILRAAKPGLLTIPGAPLVLCSSTQSKANYTPVTRRVSASRTIAAWCGKLQPSK
jgi:phage terminase large subunit-like protein